MLRCLGPKRVQELPNGQPEDISGIAPPGEVTDDPLATIDPCRKGQKIYSVSRINPLFEDALDSPPLQPPEEFQNRTKQIRFPLLGGKSSSSGYGGSNGDSCIEVFHEKIQSDEDLSPVSEKQNATYLEPIQISDIRKKIPSSGSSSSGIGNLGTIIEGKTDTIIPSPIWPRREQRKDCRDSLVDEALLLYTSSSYVPHIAGCNENTDKDVSVKDFLLELSTCISATIEGKNGVSPEQMLKSLRERIATSLEALKTTTDEEMRRLCINLGNRKKVASVVRAFSNTSSSDNSSQSSPRPRTYSSDAEDPYLLPSGSSSSGFSDSVKVRTGEDAFIYANFRASDKGDNERVNGTGERTAKKGLLEAANDGKPSVWQQYYGVNLALREEVALSSKPTDVPLYPGGRPEADFTLDMPRSEMLSKRMKEDKKWRCRCRMLTSFLGLVFFLLSVMAVSLMLTRGKRMFGSMM